MMSHTPLPGLPTAKNPKRSTQAKERYQQDTQGLGNLGEGYQHVGVLHSECTLVLGQIAEVGQERIGEAVGNLQRHSQEHREDEENSHLPLLEKGKGPQSHGVHQGLLLRRTVHRTLGQGQGIESQQDTECTRNHILHRGLLHGSAAEMHQIHEPHRADKAHCTPYPDRREILDRILPGLLEDGVGHRVGDSDGRHEEGYAHGIQPEEGAVLHRLAGRDPVDTRTYHGCSCHQMADTQQSLRRNPFVGDNTHDSGHENRHDALDGVEHADFLPEPHTGQISSLACQISSPDSKL